MSRRKILRKDFKTRFPAYLVVHLMKGHRVSGKPTALIDQFIGSSVDWLRPKQYKITWAQITGNDFFMLCSNQHLF